MSTGRCGSTSLYSLIDNHLPKDYYKEIEPFNPGIKRQQGFIADQKSIIESENNVLIKTLIGHTQDGIDVDDMYTWIFNFFDVIIILDRRDKRLQVESFSYQTYKNDNRWHDRRKYEMKLVPEEILNHNRERLDSTTKKLEDLSIEYNKKIYYYEDIFIDNNMELINEIFDMIGQKPIQKFLNYWVISDDKRVRLKEEEIRLL
jgi:hypothetical protein